MWYKGGDYQILDLSIKLNLLLLILGAKVQKNSNNIDTIIEMAEKKIKSKIELKVQRNVQINFEFDFRQHEKRAWDEYKDLQAYIGKGNINYVFVENEGKKKKTLHEINFGVINTHKLSHDQLTSSNVWLSCLDKTLKEASSEKLDLTYFENESCNVQMNLSQKFFFDIDDFMRYQQENFPSLDSRNMSVALEEITSNLAKEKRKGNKVLILSF